MKRSFAAVGSMAGVVLGFGAPVGGLILGMVFFGDFSLRWLSREIQEHLYYYSYMVFLTPVVFGLFGRYLGALNDRVSLQNRSLESLKNILEVRSMTDDVTGLYNHRHLLEEIEREIERSRRHSHCLSGIMVDIDGFKDINDTRGHLMGDRMLRELAYVLNQSIRKVDIIGRYGGDEFVIILPEADLSAAHEVCERILQNVRQHRFGPRRDYISMTVSIGLFAFDDLKHLDSKKFIEKIDEAMFSAKQSGKNRMFVMA